MDPIDWERYGDEERAPRSPGKRRKKEKHFPEPVKPQKQKEDWEKIQKDSEDGVLRHVESRWEELPTQEKEEKIKVYMRWIKDSLNAGYPILDDGDIKSEQGEDGKKITLKFLPALISAKSGNEIESKKLLYERLGDHLKIWKKTSPEFKKNTLEMNSKVFAKDVFDRN